MSLQFEDSLVRVCGGRGTAISLQGELGAYIEETVRGVTPRFARSMIRQQAVFEGGGCFEFFQVPEPLYRG